MALIILYCEIDDSVKMETRDIEAKAKIRTKKLSSLIGVNEFSGRSKDLPSLNRERMGGSRWFR